MFSFIIPTMWRGVEIRRMLPLLDAHPLVDDIIVVNNDRLRTPKWTTEINWKNVRVIDEGRNLYVNPSWNKAVDIAKNEQIALLSDDVLFDLTVLSFIEDNLKDGPIGLDSHQIMYNTLPKEFSDADFIPQSREFQLVEVNKMEYGWGILMFVNKSSWIPIPNKFLIFMGDEWIFQIALQTNKKPKIIRGLDVITRDNSTSNSVDLVPIGVRDMKLGNKC